MTCWPWPWSERPWHFLKYTEGLEVLRVLLEHRPANLIHYMEKTFRLVLPPVVFCWVDPLLQFCFFVPAVFWGFPSSPSSIHSFFLRNKTWVSIWCLTYLWRCFFLLLLSIATNKYKYVAKSVLCEFFCTVRYSSVSNFLTLTFLRYMDVLQEGQGLENDQLRPPTLCRPPSTPWDQVLCPVTTNASQIHKFLR